MALEPIQRQVFSDPDRMRVHDLPPFDSLRPQLLTEKAVRAFDSPDWLYELKFDGYRLLAEFGDGVPSPRLRTRGGAAADRWFPEVVLGLAAVQPAGRCIVDGEVVVLDHDGRCDFDALHARALRRRYVAGAPLAVYCVFDVLLLNGVPVHWRSNLERKELLRELIAPVGHPALRYVEHFPEQGKALYAAAIEMLQEGIVAKRASSLYVPDGRSSDWLKIKRPGAVPAGRFRRGEA